MFVMVKCCRVVVVVVVVCFPVIGVISVGEVIVLAYLSENCN